MARLLLGKPVVDAIADDLRPRVGALAARGVTPTLAIIRMGERPDDLSYERSAEERAEGIGVSVRRVVLPSDASQAQLMEAIGRVNADDSIHGCLMFRPLPSRLDEVAACDALEASKDVDGAGLRSLARVFSGRGEGFPPCTAAACLEMLDHYGIDVAGKRVAVAGRSLVIGRPVSLLLLERDATVTLCHSRTQDMRAILRDADVAVLATGRARAFGPDFFCAGQTVIDVGINFDDAGAMCGDADFDAVVPVLGEEGAITPVPRGIGGVTASLLMKHVVEAAERSSVTR